MPEPQPENPQQADLRPVTLSTQGPPSTVLPPEPDGLLDALADAEAAAGEQRRELLGAAAARWPRSSLVWAALSAHARDDIEAYAYARVGYHRGLDALRGNGWRGSGYVRWSAPTNHGFLRSLQALARAAERIGELDEAERCRVFLGQCDPAGPPAG